MKYVGLQEQIRSNRIKSIMLIITYPIILFLTVIYVYGFYEQTKYNKLFPYWYSPYTTEIAGYNILDRMVASMPFGAWYTVCCVAIGLPIITIAGATEDIIEDSTLGGFNLGTTAWQRRKAEKALKNVALKAGVTPPKLRIIERTSMNAYASGLSKKTYTISLTQGIIDGLTGPELESVIAHEMTHILNHDTALLTLGIIFTGFYTILIGLSAGLAVFGFLGKIELGMIGLVLTFVLIWLLAPSLLLTVITRACISRKREYLADAGAAEITNNPMKLVSALKKIERNGVEGDSMFDLGLMFVSPKKNITGWLRIFDSHPPVQKRIEFLSQLACMPVNNK